LKKSQIPSTKSQTPSNAKLQSSNDKEVILAFKHLDLNCHLDFDVWTLFVIWILAFGIYLGFGFCNLDFDIWNLANEIATLRWQ
jgi:hypothetical protein